MTRYWVDTDDGMLYRRLDEFPVGWRDQVWAPALGRWVDDDRPKILDETHGMWGTWLGEISEGEARAYWPPAFGLPGRSKPSPRVTVPPPAPKPQPREDPPLPPEPDPRVHVHRGQGRLFDHR